MGTRSLTVFKQDNGKEICVMYRQFDGYPNGGLGQELADFLMHKEHNGIDCLCASVISHFKGDDVGNVYIHPAGTRDCGEEWVYTVYLGEKGKAKMQVQGGSVTFFGMPGTKQKNMPILFDDYPDKYDGEKISKDYDDQYNKIQNDFLKSKEKKSKKAKISG